MFGRIQMASAPSVDRKWSAKIEIKQYPEQLNVVLPLGIDFYRNKNILGRLRGTNIHVI